MSPLDTSPDRLSSPLSYRLGLTACSLFLSTLLPAEALALSSAPTATCQTDDIPARSLQQFLESETPEGEQPAIDLEQITNHACPIEMLLALGKAATAAGHYEKSLRLYHYLDALITPDINPAQLPTPIETLRSRAAINAPVSSQTIVALQDQAKVLWQQQQQQRFARQIKTLIKVLEAKVLAVSEPAQTTAATVEDEKPAAASAGTAAVPTVNTSPQEPSAHPLTEPPQPLNSSQSSSVDPALNPAAAEHLNAADYRNTTTASRKQVAEMLAAPETTKTPNGSLPFNPAQAVKIEPVKTDPCLHLPLDQASPVATASACGKDNEAAVDSPASSVEHLIEAGYNSISNEEFDTALEQFQDVIDILDQFRPLSLDQASARLGMATALVGLGQGDQAREHLQQVSTILEELPDSDRKADLLNSSAQLYFALEDYEMGIAEAETALQIYTGKNQEKQAATMLFLANTLHFLERYEDAIDRYEQLIALYAALGQPAGEANAYVDLGNIHFDLGNFTEARQYYAAAVSRWQDLDDHERDLAIALLRLSDTQIRLGNFDEARHRAEDALDLFESLPDPAADADASDSASAPFDKHAFIRQAHSNISLSYLRTNRYEAAFDTLNLSLGITRTAANLEADLGKWPEAIRIARGVVDLLLIANPFSFGFLQTLQGLLTLSDFSFTVIDNADIAANVLSEFTADRVRNPLVRAENSLKTQLDNAQQAGDQRDQLSALLGLGRINLELQRYDEAIARYGEALELAQALASLSAEAEALLGLSTSHYHLSELDPLKDYANQLLRLATQQDFENQAFYLASAHLNLARQSFSESDHEATQSQAEEALGQFQALRTSVATAPDSSPLTLRTLPKGQQSLADGVANAHLLLAHSHISQGNYDRAIDNANLALEDFKALQDLSGEASALLILSAANEKLGQYQRAMDLAREALYVSRNIGDLTAEASALNTIGNVLYAQRRYRQASNSFGLARDILETQGQLEESLGRGAVPRIVGRIESALETILSFIPGNTGLGRLAFFVSATRSIVNISEGVAAHTGLSDTSLVLGETDQAFQFYTDTQKIAQELGDVQSEVNALIGLSRVYLLKQDPASARDRAQEAIELADEIRYQSGLGYAYIALSQAYLGLTENDGALYPEAFSAAQAALVIFSDIGEQEGLALALSSTGDVLAAQGNRATAIAFYKKAVETKESIEQEITTSKLQLSYARSSLEIYRKLVDLLIEQDRVLEAQYYLERLKAQELREYTNDERAGNTGPQASLLPQEAEIIAEYNTLVEFGKRLRACEATSCANLSALRTQRDNQFREYRQAISNLDTFVSDRLATGDNPDLLLNPTTFANQAKEIIDQQPGTVVVYPLVLDDKLWLLWAADGRVISRREVPVSREELGNTVIRFRQLLQDRYSDLDELKAVAKQLYDWLIAPIETELTANQEIHHLVFSLDRTTRYIPMAALYDGEQYLIEKYTVATILSASLTDVSRRTPVGTEGVSVVGAGVSQGVENFSPLTHVPIELDAIVREQDNPADTRGLYVGEQLLDASFTFNALRDALAGRQFLHIATHAEFVPGDRDASYLLMGNRREQATAEKLPIPEIETLGTYMEDVHLVVLSACQTALGGPNQEGLEIAGLGYYFLKSQVDAVMASLWNVSDASTSQLMQEFYGVLATSKTSNPVTKAEALRQAQLALLRSNDAGAAGDDRFTLVPRNDEAERPAAGLAHPYYWAPFILIGNSL